MSCRASTPLKHESQQADVPEIRVSSHVNMQAMSSLALQVKLCCSLYGFRENRDTAGYPLLGQSREGMHHIAVQSGHLFAG